MRSWSSRSVFGNLHHSSFGTCALGGVRSAEDRILDECCAVCNFHRNYAVHLLNRPVKQPRFRLGKPFTAQRLGGGAPDAGSGRPVCNRLRRCPAQRS